MIEAPERAAAPDPQAVIATLRQGAVACREAARMHPVRARKVLAEIANDGSAAAFALELPQLIRRRPVILPPGAPVRSCEEDWLAAVAEAIARGDTLSERFLLRRHCTQAGACKLADMMRARASRPRAAPREASGASRPAPGPSIGSGPGAKTGAG
jgi:hypothetical protein